MRFLKLMRVAVIFSTAAAILFLASASDDDPTYWGPHNYVYRNATQTIPNAANTVVSFNPAQEGGDWDNMFDPDHPTYMVCPKEAVYLVTAQAVFEEPNGVGHCSVYLEENTNGTWERRAQQRIPSPEHGDAMVSVAATFAVNAGDKVRMVVRQTSGGPLDLLVGNDTTNYRPKLAVVFLRPQYGYE